MLAVVMEVLRSLSLRHASSLDGSIEEPLHASCEQSYLSIEVPLSIVVLKGLMRAVVSYHVVFN